MARNWMGDYDPQNTTGWQEKGQVETWSPGGDGATTTSYNPPPSSGGGGGPPAHKPPPPSSGGGGGPPAHKPLPKWAKRYNKNLSKGPSAWERFLKHREYSQLMKGMVSKPMSVPNYTHALGGYDWKQNFPNTPELLDKGLAYGYQHLTEIPRGIMNIDPMSSIYSDTGIIGSLFNAINKANTEAAKNVQGFTGEGISPEALAQYIGWQTGYPVINLAHGGIVDLYRHGGF